MSEKKERRALAFRVSIEFINELFELIKKRKYKIIPKDAKIHSIKYELISFDNYSFIITSEKFPIVPQECNCDVGYIKVHQTEGIIELKERE